MAVSLSVTTEKGSMPIAFRRYLPETWTKDRKRRKKTGVPEEIEFQTKTGIVLEQIQRARQRGIPQGVVLADAGYGNDTSFRVALTEMELTYVMGVQSNMGVWKPGEKPKPAPARQGNTGRPRKLLQRDSKHHPISVRELGHVVAGRGMDQGHLAAGSKEETAIALCRFAGCGRHIGTTGERNHTRKNGC